MKTTMMIMLSLAMIFVLPGCVEDDYEDDYSTSSSNSSSSSSGSSSGGSYDYTFTCPITNQSHTVPIPRGSCESEYKQYARVFGCNDVGNFNRAACALERCTGQRIGCGSY